MKDFVVIYLPIMCIFMTIWLLYVGGIVIVKKRPFILKAYHIMLLLFLSFVPVMLIPFINFSQALSKLGNKAYLLLLTPLVFILLLIMYKIMLKGYVIFGVTKDSFREPLLQSLKILDMEFEETIYGIKLKTDNILIQSNIQTQMGTAQLFCKDSKSQALGSIVSELKKIYADTKVELNYICPIFYCILAFCMLGFSFLLLSLPK